MKIPITDIDVTLSPHRKPGGQHVGVGTHTVVVTHKPTKQFVGVSTLDRSQHAARTIAMTLLEMILEE